MIVGVHIPAIKLYKKEGNDDARIQNKGYLDKGTTWDGWDRTTWLDVGYCQGLSF